MLDMQKAIHELPLPCKALEVAFSVFSRSRRISISARKYED